MVSRRTAELEEIVVTARKQEKRPQDVPLAVAVFTSGQLTGRGARDMHDVSRFTLGFPIDRTDRCGAQGGVSRPVIRGMSNTLGGDNAQIFIDGIPYSDSVLPFPFDIVERVEMIKGPQAVLFGRATFSGAISLITKKGGNEAENVVSARLAEYGDTEMNLLSRGPLVDDRLDRMVHGRHYTMDGLYRNAFDNDRCYPNVARQYCCGEVQQEREATLDRAGLQGTEGQHRDSARLSLQISLDLPAGLTLVSNPGLFSTEMEYGCDPTHQDATAFGITAVPNAPSYVRTVTDPVRAGGVMRNEVTDRDEWSTELRLESGQTARRYVVGAYYAFTGRKHDRIFNPAHTGEAIVTSFSAGVENDAGPSRRSPATRSTSVRRRLWPVT